MDDKVKNVIVKIVIGLYLFISWINSGNSDSTSSIDYCMKPGCTKTRAKYSSYCSYHLSSNSSSSTTSSTKKSTTTSSTKSYTSSSKKTSTTKTKYSYPDCDDYDSLDDFLDDWDGRNPGGMDAEDYWDNW